MNDNENLLNLCRLNAMEEKLQAVEALDKDQTLKTIQHKKNELVRRISQEQEELRTDD